MSASVVLSLIEHIKTVAKLKKFVLSGSLADVLTDSDLTAARKAIDKAKIAKDKALQTWSAVNHLESAHARLEREYKGGGDSYVWRKYQHAERLLDKDQWVLCLMATCYRALDEIPLAAESLETARYAYKVFGDAHPAKEPAWYDWRPNVAFVQLVDPAIYVELYRRRDFYNVDMAQMCRTIMACDPDQEKKQWKTDPEAAISMEYYRLLVRAELRTFVPGKCSVCHGEVREVSDADWEGHSVGVCKKCHMQVVQLEYSKPWVWKTRVKGGSQGGVNWRI